MSFGVFSLAAICEGASHVLPAAAAVTSDFYPSLAKDAAGFARAAWHAEQPSARPISSRRFRHTAGCGNASSLRSIKVTLSVHPLFGQVLTLRSDRGRLTTFGEMDGELRHLPRAWTSLCPRPKPLELDGQPVFLAPHSLRELSAWVAYRSKDKGRKFAVTIDRCDKGNHDKGHGGGAESTAAMVGQARSAGVGGRGRSGEGGKQ
jgi:hypothetical protein